MNRGIRRSIGEKTFTVANIGLLVAFSLTIIYPFLHVSASALSSESAVVSGRVTFFPVDPTLEPLRELLVNQNYRIAMYNTIFITVVGTILNILFTSALAYPLSRRGLPFARTFNLLVVFTMFFSGGMIPTYLVVRNLGLLDTYGAYLFPGLIQAFYCLLLRNFFASIPKELEESALIDGANHFVVLVRIIIPLSLAAIATIGLFYAVGHWNVFFTAIIYITKRELWTLQVFLREVVSQAANLLETNEIEQQHVALESLKMAAIIVSVLPILMVYPFVQKYFVKGVMVGSVKG